MAVFLGTLNDLYKDFQKKTTLEGQIEFLKKHKKMNLAWDIKWDNLIAAWIKEWTSPEKMVRIAQGYSLMGDEGESFDAKDKD